MYNIRFERSQNLKEKPKDESKLSFGDVFTDHMFVMNYDEGKGWHDPRVVPYGPISLEPSAMVFHYAQEAFEGLKAYRTEDNRVLLFRPDQNFERMNTSNERLCIPFIDEKLALEGLKKLIDIERDWVPSSPGTSLYIRPFVIATDPHIGVRPAKQYMFFIILAPVGAYYREGINPVKIYVETKYVRAVRGSTGHIKTGGNYASSLKSQAEAMEKKYTQVLWLDGVERKYIEEVGTMNVFFKIGDQVITPALEGSILPGITRKSTIDLLRSWGMKVVERRISIDELAEAYDKGELKEAFGTGTAAVISPIGHLNWGDKKIMDINNGEIGEVSQRLYDTLTGIQGGRLPDPFGWTIEVK